MNMQLFVDSLSPAEMNELSNIIYWKQREYARQNIKPLTADECQLAVQGYPIHAIKMYRDRNGSSLLEAKMAVDAVRD